MLCMKVRSLGKVSYYRGGGRGVRKKSNVLLKICPIKSREGGTKTSMGPCPIIGSFFFWRRPLEENCVTVVGTALVTTYLQWWWKMNVKIVLSHRHCCLRGQTRHLLLLLQLMSWLRLKGFIVYIFFSVMMQIFLKERPSQPSKASWPQSQPQHPGMGHCHNVTKQRIDVSLCSVSLCQLTGRQ